ncbi:hypothetical protein T484DRAFT_1976867, partial [Baffinella frigidus]
MLGAGAGAGVRLPGQRWTATTSGGRGSTPRTASRGAARVRTWCTCQPARTDTAGLRTARTTGASGGPLPWQTTVRGKQRHRRARRRAGHRGSSARRPSPWPGMWRRRSRRRSRRPSGGPSRCSRCWTRPRAARHSTPTMRSRLSGAVAPRRRSGTAAPRSRRARTRSGTRTRTPATWGPRARAPGTWGPTRCSRRRSILACGLRTRRRTGRCRGGRRGDRGSLRSRICSARSGRTWFSTGYTTRGAS